MSARARHWSDLPLDFAGPAAPATAWVWASATLAPLLGLPAAPIGVGGATVLFGIGFSAMRRAGRRYADFDLPAFHQVEAEEERDELLLDSAWMVPADRASIDRSMAALAELLLDDPLAPQSEDARVVRLFEPVEPKSPEAMLRSMNLRRDESDSNADHGDPLRAALADLKRSLASG
jgi:hypothetical protein